MITGAHVRQRVRRHRHGFGMACRSHRIAEHERVQPQAAEPLGVVVALVIGQDLRTRRRAAPARRPGFRRRGRGMTVINDAMSTHASTVPQPVEDLAGVRFDEGVGIGLVRGDVDLGRIQVAQVDGLDGLPRDAGRQRHRHPVALAVLGVPAALAAQVGGVREVAPRAVHEPVPLPEEVVAVVVADLADLRVHHRDLGDVRRVDDHLAAVGHDRFQLVEALGSGPDVLVLGGHDRQHPTVRTGRGS